MDRVLRAGAVAAEAAEAAVRGGRGGRAGLARCHSSILKVCKQLSKAKKNRALIFILYSDQ